MTENPRTDQLAEQGIPEELRPYFAGHGLGGLVEKMGMVFEELTPEKASARFPVEGNTQIAGLVHGGAHVVLAETLGSIAANLYAGPEHNAVGVDINATHTRSTSSGWVHGTAEALHLGRTMCVHEVVMTDDEGRRLSTARITNRILPKK